MPWFVHHQAALYWIALIASLASRWSFRDSSAIRKRSFVIPITSLTIAGIYVIFHPFLSNVENTRTTYWWSIASLLPLVLISASELLESKTTSADEAPHSPKMYRYSGALLSAAVISVVYIAGARVRIHSQTPAPGIHGSDFEYAAWSLISHIALALAVLSVVNLVLLASLKTAKPGLTRMALNAALIFAALWTVLFGFLDSALSFSGWSAHLYAASLALALTAWAFSLVVPFLQQQSRAKATLQLGTWAVLLAACALALAFPYLVGDADWSGFLQSTVTLLLWIVITVCLYRLRPARVQYSLATVFAVILIGAAIYKGLQITEIFWSKPLGSTDDDISLNLEAYGTQDNSFLLAHHILGNARHEVCGDLCRILRENSNIRDTRARTDIQLVDHLTPTKSERPNIFVFVIDSMRPDYLGAYNPNVDYTPNLDAFARDSIVLHNTYSQYAGTSLSEPAIWSGAMMLHAHYVQPFSRLNSLDRMLHTDGYRMIVSWDEILSIILPPNDDVVKLDTDKKLWHQLEIGSTIKQAEAVLDSRTDLSQPVFVYAQPKNVHQFARNDVPSPTSQHWPDRPGLNNRITYEVHWVDSRLGEFFAYLKQHGMYDDSIIIVTSDHGDATGELGRKSHSTCIWPEIMHVPLIVHLPRKMRQQLVYDDARLSTLTDIAPSLYYLLGHKPIRENPLFGRPLFTETRQELESYPRRDLLLASDVRAVYGILTADGRYLYTTYDAPAQSYLFDLLSDANAQHNILTTSLKQHYDEQIIDDLHQLGNFYGYRPGVESLLASSH
jgi:general stress protein CsbA